MMSGSVLFLVRLSHFTFCGIQINRLLYLQNKNKTVSLQVQVSAAKGATHQSMFEAKSFSIHREPASSRWAVGRWSISGAVYVRFYLCLKLITCRVKVFHF